MVPESYLFTLCIFVLGLIAGSFFNVVIYRLPIILETSWKKQAKLILDLPIEKQSKRFNLAYPRSHCPNCQMPIKFYNNIPLLSYMLQGHCRYCRHKISRQYLLVELITGLIFALLYYRFGLSCVFLGGILFSSLLIILATIDLNTQLLPDVITIPLLWIGLLFNLFSVYDINLDSAVLGAIIGYVFFWMLYQIFTWVLGKQAMGYGDFKLFSALGAWLGISSLPIILLIASAGGLIVAILLQANKGQEIPFGPALAISGLIVFIFYPEIMTLMALDKL